MLAAGIIGGLVAMGLAYLAINRPKPASLSADGWKELRPGKTLHFCLVGCLFFVVVVPFFFAKGGSARTDAHEQNIAALVLMLAFGACGAYLYWVAYLRKVQWRGDEIRILRPFATDFHYFISNIVSLTEGFDGSELKLKMSDGRTWRFSIYQHGFVDLVQHIVERFEALGEEAG